MSITSEVPRLRTRPAVRRFLERTALTPADLSHVLLVTEDAADRPMPTVTVAEIPARMVELRQLGIRSVKIFAEATERDRSGLLSASPDSLMARAVGAAKEAAPELAVMTETCLCAYTETGTCYVGAQDGRPDLAATAEVTARQAVAHADAGADIVGPASMVLATIRACRTALDQAGHHSVSTMPHIIFHSGLYDDYRRTMGAAPTTGTDREFQIHPTQHGQFVDAALTAAAQGADMLLLEPALFSADVLVALKRVTSTPIMPFSVSGEYTRLAPPDSGTGRRDLRVLTELFTTLKRAGADATITYAAVEIARELNS